FAAAPLANAPFFWQKSDLFGPSFKEGLNKSQKSKTTAPSAKRGAVFGGNWQVRLIAAARCRTYSGPP
ncbi:MAG: hypothetical protein QM537_10090, partial [Candidatus Symbiobacter sp.]|nr:hypothetical protein [Candidatus Symbiobacter sp.]